MFSPRYLSANLIVLVAAVSQPFLPSKHVEPFPDKAAYKQFWRAGKAQLHRVRTRQQKLCATVAF
jgi:hypothetical protein